MPNFPFNASTDGIRLTVNAMVRTPSLVPARVLAMLDQQFLADALLRPGPPAPSGVVGYHESTPLYLQSDPEDVAEGAEIPVTYGQLGDMLYARTQKKALGIRITEEMVRRNNVDAVNVQMTQLRNTFVRAYDKAWLTLILDNPKIPVIAATAPWDGSGATPRVRYDISRAKYAIQTAYPTGADASQVFGFQPDTVAFNSSVGSMLEDSDEYNRIFVGNIAAQNLRYTGVLPRQISGLDALHSPNFPAGYALVMERRTFGFISDERPLESKPLYQHLPTETWRSDTVRQSVMAVDQPYACAIISGVATGTGAYTTV